MSNFELNTQLVFKGGTCLYLFYDLPRFSVDLDFNLKLEKEFKPDEVTKILESLVTVKEHENKRYTWFWNCSYQTGKPHIKVEINKRKYPDEVQIKSFLGLSIPTLAPASLAAHKLCAITDRRQLANRDLFDAHYMLEKGFPIAEEIIRLRTGQSVVEYLESLRRFIPDAARGTSLLQGLGELLDEKKKVWVKQHLLAELDAELALRAEYEAKRVAAEFEQS